MSLAPTPTSKPAPQLVGACPYLALLADPNGENRLMVIEDQAGVSDLFAGRPLRFLDLEFLGGMLVADEDESSDLPVNERASGAFRAAWLAVRGEMLETQIEKPVIRGPALFVGFSYSAPPPWFHRTGDEQGLSDAEALSVEYLLADPAGWTLHNGLPF